MMMKKANLKILQIVFVFLAVFLLIILPNPASATHLGPGSYPDRSCDFCPDADKDGLNASCDLSSPPPNTSYGCGYGLDCDDNNPWSQSFGSKDIASVKVEYSPDYVVKTQTDKKFTPDSKKFNPLLGGLQVTVTFKAKKCYMVKHGSPDFTPMKVYYTTKDSSGSEISLGLQLLANNGSITASDSLVRVSDLVYRGSIPGINSLTSNVEPYIASVAAGRPVQLKFLGSDIGPNKDTPKYQPLPMTNCAQTYGSGRHKVVYMRSYDPGTSLPGYIALANQAIYNGFNVIEPFKKYQSEFSHYIDLKLQALPGVSLSKSLSISQLKYDANMVRNASSCGSKGSLYVLFDSGDGSSPRASGLKNSVVIMDGEFLDEEEYAVDIGPIAVHEAGHAFAGLMDEYLYPNARSRFPASLISYLLRAVDSGSNCSTKPSTQYSYLSRIYGRIDSVPCSLAELSKPSANSLMMGGYRGNENQFNVVSCGYILKAIKKSGTAKSYWSECAAMSGMI